MYIRYPKLTNRIATFLAAAWNILHGQSDSHDFLLKRIVVTRELSTLSITRLTRVYEESVSRMQICREHEAPRCRLSPSPPPSQPSAPPRRPGFPANWASLKLPSASLFYVQFSSVIKVRF